MYFFIDKDLYPLLYIFCIYGQGSLSLFLYFYRRRISILCPIYFLDTDLYSCSIFSIDKDLYPLFYILILCGEVVMV